MIIVVDLVSLLAVMAITALLVRRLLRTSEKVSK
jgi:hypothetical protein